MCKLRHSIIIILQLICFLSAVSSLWAEEEILSFNAEGRVESTNGAVVITEQIRFRAEGNKIRFGLIRSLPKKEAQADNPRAFSYEYLRSSAKSTDASGNTLQEALPVTVKDNDSHVLYFLGTHGKVLEPGIYEFTIQYRAFGLIHQSDKDNRVRWEITGSWPFAIHSVSARFFPPARLSPKSATARAWLTRTTKGWFGKGWFGSESSEDETIAATISTDPVEKNDLGEPKTVVNVQHSEPQGAIISVQVEISWPKGLLVSTPS